MRGFIECYFIIFYFNTINIVIVVNSIGKAEKLQSKIPRQLFKRCHEETW